MAEVLASPATPQPGQNRGVKRAVHAGTLRSLLPNLNGCWCAGGTPPLYNLAMTEETSRPRVQRQGPDRHMSKALVRPCHRQGV